MNTLDFVTQNSRALILLSLQFYLVLVSAACRQEKAQHLKSKKADIRLRCCALLATFSFFSCPSGGGHALVEHAFSCFAAPRALTFVPSGFALVRVRDRKELTLFESVPYFSHFFGSENFVTPDGLKVPPGPRGHSGTIFLRWRS